jgi:hypothetical protein
MEATVSGIEKGRQYNESTKSFDDIVLVKVMPDSTGYAVLPYPASMASLFPLGKRVEITVSEARDPQHELLRRIEQQREYEQGV